jgi:O-antigen/teichoic acid export membrane protein
MRPLASAVLWRYLAIATQFAVVVLVAKNMSTHHAGQYFAIFGLVSVCALVAGLGTPDGAVMHLPVLREAGRRSEIGSLIGRVMVNVGLTSLAGSLVCLVAALAGFGSVTLVALAVTWWAGISLVWVNAQLLAGLGYGGLGAFVGYSVTNFCYLLTFVPYLTIADDVTLAGALVSTSLATWISVLVSAGVLIGALRSRRTDTDHGYPHGPTRQRLLADGVGLMITRLMQASLAWIPLWILALLNGSESAAVYGAASRLAVAATAGVAALRFAARSQIVLFHAREDFPSINRLARQCSTVSMAIPILAIALLSTYGDGAMVEILGRSYISVGSVLMVLMFGVLAEAFGGISDEILKMSRHALAVVIEIGGAVRFARHGPVAVAWVTAAAFTFQYAFQMAWLSKNTQVKPWPLRRSNSEG